MRHTALLSLTRLASSAHIFPKSVTPSRSGRRRSILLLEYASDPSSSFLCRHQLLDYDAARSKARKMGEKSSEDPIRLRAVRFFPPPSLIRFERTISYM